MGAYVLSHSCCSPLYFSELHCALPLLDYDFVVLLNAVFTNQSLTLKLGKKSFLNLTRENKVGLYPVCPTEI